MFYIGVFILVRSCVEAFVMGGFDRFKEVAIVAC